MIWGLHLPFRKKTSNRTVLAFFPAEEDQTAQVDARGQERGIANVMLNTKGAQGFTSSISLLKNASSSVMRAVT